MIVPKMSNAGFLYSSASTTPPPPPSPNIKARIIIKSIFMSTMGLANQNPPGRLRHDPMSPIHSNIKKTRYVLPLERLRAPMNREIVKSADCAG